MTVYRRADWGSTGEPGGYDLPGPVSEVSGSSCSQSVVPVVADLAARKTLSGGVSTTIAHPEVVASKFVASIAVRLASIAGDWAVSPEGVHAHGYHLEMCGVAAAGDLAQMVDGEAIGDRPNKQFPRKSVAVGTDLAVRDHPVSTWEAGCRPKPAAALGVDGDLRSHAVGQKVYAKHRITSPGVWSHAPGCPTSAGAPSFQSTDVDGFKRAAGS